jgi:hypothetical protein
MGFRGRNAGNSSNFSYQWIARANMPVMDEGQGQSSSEQNEVKKGEQQTDTSFGNFAHFVYTNEGKIESASIAMDRLNSEWVLDSGATKHVSGSIGEFESYYPCPPMHQQTIQTVDRTAQPIKENGVVQCITNIKLSSVLHVPAFPVNLL